MFARFGILGFVGSSIIGLTTLQVHLRPLHRAPPHFTGFDLTSCTVTPHGYTTMDVNWAGVSLGGLSWEIRDTHAVTDDPATGNLDASGSPATDDAATFDITSGTTPNFKFFWIRATGGGSDTGWYGFHNNGGDDYDVSDCMW